MRLHKLAIALTVGVLGATFAVAAPTGLPSKHFGTPIGTLELMLRKRQTSRLFNEADKRFADDPDSPDGHAIRGAAFAIQGWPTESIVSFELAAGGEFYEEEGLRYLAEALREVGRADEAAELRRELRMVPTPNPYAYIAIEANLVDDLRAAEAWDEALEAAEFLLETEPGNSIVHSTVADLMWAMGDVDEALFQLFLVSEQGRRSYRYREVLAHMAADEGLLDDAAEQLAAARKQRARLPRIRALQLDVLCELGEEEHILAEFDYPRFRDHGHPDLLAAEATCRARRGELEVAAALADDLRVMFPDLPRAQASVAFVEAALQSE